MTIKQMRYFFENDSTHGKYPVSVECDGNDIIIGGGKYIIHVII